MLTMQIIIALFTAYLFGSISSAIIVCRLLKLPDPRTRGSKNPGATNVLRIGGKKAALITLLGDVLKGFIPVLLFKLLGFPTPVIAGAMFGAFFGHLYPVFFDFDGGKGVATLLGCLMALSPIVSFFWLLTFILVAYVTRYVAVASMLSALVAPLYVWYFTQNINYTFTIILMSLILVFRHHSNIRNIWKGTEVKIGTLKKSVS